MMPRRTRVALGLDASTSAVKALAFDECGKECAGGRAPLEISFPGPSLAEQSAESWWQAAVSALREVTSQTGGAEIASLAIAHQRESFVLVDPSGAPLRSAILWMDERSRPYLPRLRERFDLQAFHLRTGKPLTGNLIPGKLAWLQEHEPQVLGRAHRLLDTHAFLIHRLTGEWATSTGSADPTGLYDIQRQAWDSVTLSALGIDPALLPPLCLPGQLIGRVTAAAARETGLPQGMPVISGLGDGQAGALGMGINRTGLCGVNLGTSIISGTFSQAYRTSNAFRTMTGALPGSYIFETVLLGGAFTLRWLVNDLFSGSAEIEARAARLPPGAGGLVLVPYWGTAMNPYWDASASGITVGWRASHRPEHFYRAALEGLGFELRLQVQGVEAALEAPIRYIQVAGGGAANPVWLQILADILGRPVEVAPAKEATALGAAILAAAGAKLHADIPSAAEAMVKPPAAVYEPLAENHARYTRLYEQVYLKLYPALREPLMRLAELDEAD